LLADHPDSRVDYELRRSVEATSKQLKDKADATNEAGAREDYLRLAQAMTDLADALQGHGSNTK